RRAAPVAELLAGLGGKAAARAGRARQRRSAFATEAGVGAIVLTAAETLHPGDSARQDSIARRRDAAAPRRRLARATWSRRAASRSSQRAPRSAIHDTASESGRGLSW